MARNAERKCGDGSERWTKNAVMALNAKTGNAALKVKLRSNNASERRNWETIMMALNAETENATLNVKLRSNNGSERRNWEMIMMALNAEIRNATLNVKLRSDDGSERRTEKRHWWLWTPKLKSDDDDSERQIEKW